ncbi:MAG TPA: hypothetical protein VK666_08685 [Chryseolinea sp.]|nr:hypothetical protein [Chryseolinea sp.]
MRLFSITAYFLIFLQGSLIKIPLGLLLLAGLTDGDMKMRVLTGLIDISLVVLLLSTFRERTRKILLLETIIYLLLLSLLVVIVAPFPFATFNYFLFLFPAACFTILFPASIIIWYRKLGKNRDTDTLLTTEHSHPE